MIITTEMARHAAEYYDVLELSNTRFWLDACGHEKEAYVCSFVIEGFFHMKRDFRLKIDLYVFHEPFVGQSLCLRTGEADSDYCSPGDVTTFIINNKNGRRDYRAICDLLCYLGRIKWEPKT